MARPVAFDRAYVLQQAINVFWLKGYKATSIKNLVDATGLQPGSLYAAFGDKRGLFLAALDAYFADMRKTILTVLHGNMPPLDRLRAFFAELVRQSCDDPERKGCLLINTLSEIPLQDTEINSRLQRMFAEVERELNGLLAEAIRNGDLPEQDAEALAKYLVAGIFGLRIFNKMQPDPRSLEDVADRLLSGVTGPGSRH